MENPATNQSLQESFVWQKQAYTAYGIVMVLILTVGFVGNVVTLLVLQRREHRSRPVTPLMINVACADIFIIVFGYPVAISANLAGRIFDEGGHCVWVGFVNGTVGITSIVTLMEMGIVSYHGLKQVNTTERLSKRKITCLIGGAWLYGVLSMLPPMLGWNRFVLTSSKVSCCPDWAARSASAITYNLLLAVVGFFLPLSIIVGCYYKIYSLVHHNFVPGNIEVQIRQRASKMKIVRMTAMSVVAFVLSWSPYCFVSLAETIVGKHVMTSGKAEIAEMLAKASVVYNPMVYTIMNSSFRATLLRILHVHRSRIQTRLTITVEQRNPPTGRHGTFTRDNPPRLQTVRAFQAPSVGRRVRTY